MHTLFDFISSVNAIQYGVALLSIVGFVLFVEIMKPRPFEGLVKAAAEDVRFMRTQSRDKLVQLLRGTVLGPVYALCYFVAVPFLFLHGVAELFGKLFVATTVMTWSPVRAYFTGQKRSKKAASIKKGSPTS